MLNQAAALRIFTRTRRNAIRVRIDGPATEPQTVSSSYTVSLVSGEVIGYVQRIGRRRGHYLWSVVPTVRPTETTPPMVNQAAALRTSRSAAVLELLKLRLGIFVKALLRRTIIGETA